MKQRQRCKTHRTVDLILVYGIVWACLSAISVNGQYFCGQNHILVNGRYYNACPNGYINEQGICQSLMMPSCPQGYTLLNGFCYQTHQIPPKWCPNGYYLHNDNGMCYPLAPLPCPSVQKPIESPKVEVNTQATPRPPPPPEPQIIYVTLPRAPEPTTEPTTLPTPSPVAMVPPLNELNLQLPPDALMKCPQGSVDRDGTCHKLICPLGEYHQGRCLQPECPEGSVWHNHRCREPGYVTTILEIENLMQNENHYRPGKVKTPVNVNNVVVYTQKPPIALTTTTTSKPVSARTHLSTYNRRTPEAIRMRPRETNSACDGDRCCSLYTPRICKLYGENWGCFNRRYGQRNQSECKVKRTIYLKAPEVKNDGIIMVIPPNPPLSDCTISNCDQNAKREDCSVCTRYDPSTCTSYCYYYMCPHDTCEFLDQQSYCTDYPGSDGCNRRDGCLWDWCGE